MSRPSIEQFKKWRTENRADFTGTPLGIGPNIRRTHCRVCNQSILPGHGIRYHELMNDFYRGSDRFVCTACEVATRPEGIAPEGEIGKAAMQLQAESSTRKATR
jgi:recombinational DNA repair protein (RecF pathway)